jgi:hypothetical protein
MQYAFLFIHSWLRWFALIMMLLVIFRSLNGWLGKKSFTKSDNTFATIMIAFLHTQLLLGIILYFMTGYHNAFAQGMGTVMKNSSLRFWAVEHGFTMVLAVVLAQIGKSRIKKIKADYKKHQILAIYTLTALVLILSRIPWGATKVVF